MKMMIRLFILVMMFLPFSGSAQTAASIIDSLELALKKADTDTLRVRLMLEIAYEHKSSNTGLSLNIGNKALELAEKINFPEGEMNAHLVIGLANYCRNYYDTALVHFQTGIALAKEIGKPDRLAVGLNNAGLVYHDQADYKNALDFYFQALKLIDNSSNKRMNANILNNIALIYQDQKKYDDELAFHDRSLRIKKEIKNQRGIGSSLHNIGLLYKMKGDLDKSLDYYMRALVERRAAEDASGTAMTLNNIGAVYEIKKEYDKALSNYQEALEIQKTLDDKFYRALTTYSIGANYSNRAQYDKGLLYINEALDISKSIGAKELIKNGYELLSGIYAKQKNFEKAFEYQLLYIQMKDSILNSENVKQLNELQTQYETEKRQKELELANKNNEIQALELNKNKLWLWIMVVAILLVITLSALLYNRYQVKQKVNKELEHRNSEMAIQKKEITDSINYAKRIQESILPPQEHWQKLLPQSFIFYRPKDIVSGDFYWIEKNGDVVCFAAVDCTGHGVPGALMSVVGFNLLTQAVNEMKLSVPAEILKHLDYGVTKTLRQSEGGIGVKDGMDLSLCSFNRVTYELQYSGAFNSLYYFHKGIFHEIKADKFPIGINLDGKVDEYTNHTIQLEKGDCVYLYSDGYADQFGGPKGKKFKYNQLKELLKRIHALPTEEQKQVIGQTFDSWKGTLDQVDDVVIIGVCV